MGTAEIPQWSWEIRRNEDDSGGNTAVTQDGVGYCGDTAVIESIVRGNMPPTTVVVSIMTYYIEKTAYSVSKVI